MIKELKNLISRLNLELDNYNNGLYSDDEFERSTNIILLDYFKQSKETIEINDRQGKLL